MFLNGLEVQQANGVYYFIDEYTGVKAQVLLPPNNDVLADYKCCDIISKAIALRWKIIKPKSK